MDPAPAPRRRGLNPALLLGLFVLVVGLAVMPAEQYIGDPMAVRMATWSLLERGRLDVPEDLALTAGQRGQYFVQNPDNGRYYSKYGELNTLGYLPAMLVERSLVGHLDPVNNLPTRTVLLNLGNALLGGVLGVLLFVLASRYTGSPRLACLWVLASLYATFGWNYLRAQTTELLQWTLYTAFFLALVDLWRGRGASRPLAAAQVLLLLLVLTKLVYVLLMPLLVVVAFLAPLQGGPGRPERGAARLVGTVLLPVAFTALVVLALNEVKFGSPWFTGYTQWTRERDLFQGNLGAGLVGFLLDPQRSVLLHDPLLLPALVALSAFWRRWRLEAAWAWLPFLAFLLLHARTTNWAGHWSYGPRYLLPVLTPVTLPALLAFEWLRPRLRTGLGASLAGGLTLLLAGSFWLQVQVNALGFFTFYRVEAAVKGFPAPRALAALRATPFGLVHAQLSGLVRSDRFPPFLQVAATEMPPEQVARLADEVRRRVRGNLLLWP